MKVVVDLNRCSGLSKKYQFDDFPARLAPIAAAVDELSDVELNRGKLELSIEEDRLIRNFARKFGGTRCVVNLLGGGLSGARVMRLRVTDGQGILVWIFRRGSPGVRGSKKPPPFLMGSKMWSMGQDVIAVSASPAVAPK